MTPIKSVYSFLWQVIKPYKHYYALMLIGPLMCAFYELTSSYCLKLVIDTFDASKTLEYSEFIYPVSLFLGAQIALDLSWRISNIAEWRSEPYVRRNIILLSYDYVQHHSYKFFQENYAGSIISKLKGILEGYDNFWANIHHELAPNIATTMILTGSLALINIQIFIFVSIWCVVFSTVLYTMSVKLSLLSFATTESKHSIFGRIADNVSNIFSLFSFASRKYEYNKIDDLIIEDYVPKEIATYKYDFKLSMTAGVFYWLMLTSVFIFIIYLRKNNQISSGDLVFVMTVTLAMSYKMWVLVMNMQNFIKHMGDFKSSLSIMSEPQNIIDKPDVTDFIIKKASIKFTNLDFVYESGSKVFSDLNLNIKSGEQIGIVGLSGAGKSTLVSILLKYFKPSKGKVIVDGVNIADVTSDSLRAQISLIPQDIMLFHRTIMENIRYGKPDANDEEVLAAAKKANIHEFVSKTKDGYATLVGERGVKLSGGQRQRIAIARAILKNAPILILDEATASLDTETEQLIQTSINAMLDDTGATVIAIAHRLSTLKHMDRIIVLDNGVIVEEGRHETLIAKKNSLYKRLWEMQRI